MRPRAAWVVTLVAACLGSVAEGVVEVRLRVETAVTAGSDTSGGAVVSFALPAGWTAYRPLCAAAAKGQVVELKATLEAWPTSVRLQLPAGSSDSWGVRRAELIDVAADRALELRPVCRRGGACGADLVRWVWSDTEATEFEVPISAPAQWLVGSWSQCCCPSSDGDSCTPGERSRLVWCSEDAEAACASGERPAASQSCQDFGHCPSDAFCPLGLHSTVSCDGQALGMLGILLWCCTTVGLLCRFGRARWLTCPSSCLSVRVVHPTCGEGEKERSHLQGDEEDNPTPSVTSARERLPAAAGREVEHLDTPCARGLSTWSPTGTAVTTPEDLEVPQEQRRTLDVSRLLGTWFYDQSSRYCLSRGPAGAIRFDEQISSGQWVFGVLEMRHEYLQGVLRARDGGLEHGRVRLKYVRETDIVVSNFQFPGDTLWGEDTVATKVPNQSPVFAHDAAVSPAAASRSRASSREGDGADKTFAKSITELVGVLSSTLGLTDATDSGASAAVAAADLAARGLAGGAEPPKTLFVVCPRLQAACGGEYELQEMRANGLPLWKKRDGNRWIYSGIDGKWYIGGQSSQRRRFDCAAGYIFRDQPHSGEMPDAVSGLWSYGDGAAWHADAGITITSRGPLTPLSTASDASADVKSLPALEARDRPGAYIVIHDNTAVTGSMDPAPPILARLPESTVVLVREVALSPDRQRLRGRIEAPAGWISILDTSDGYRWARRQSQEEVASSETSTRGSCSNASHTGSGSGSGTACGSSLVGTASMPTSASSAPGALPPAAAAQASAPGASEPPVLPKPPRETLPTRAAGLRGREGGEAAGRAAAGSRLATPEEISFEVVDGGSRTPSSGSRNRFYTDEP